MKKTLFSGQVLAFVLLTLIFSCKKDAIKSTKNPASPAVFTASADSNFVSFSTAASAARQITNSHMVSEIIKEKEINSLGLPSNHDVLDSVALPNNVNPSYYIFNYKSGGFVIMPADKRVEPILAYSGTGYFPLSGPLPGGLSRWLTINDQNMQKLRKNTSLKVPHAVAELWKEMVPQIFSRKQAIDVNQPPPPPPTCQNTYNTFIVGPFIQTTWAQGYPYDLLCPNALNPSTSYWAGLGKDPTGCVATAMAQTMYYWKYPTRYNWTAMPTSSIYPGSNTGNTAVAQLMVDAGRSVNMAYGDQTSGAYDKDIAGALKSSFGYSSATYGPYTSTSFNTIEANLNAHQPVIFGGATGSNGTGGHTWASDGYQTITEYFCPSGDTPAYGYTYLLFHMNWGWNEVGITTNVNGWYYYNLWSVYNGNTLENFQYYQDMTYNIHP